MEQRVMGDFYTARPELQGRVPKILEEALRIKLISLEHPGRQTAMKPTHYRESTSFVAEIQ